MTSPSTLVVTATTSTLFSSLPTCSTTSHSITSGPSSFLLSLLAIFVPVNLLANQGLGQGGGEWLILPLLGFVARYIPGLFQDSIEWVMSKSFVQASFADDDDCYNWLLMWLTRQQTWHGSGTVHISTLSSNVEDGDTLMLAPAAYTTTKTSIYVQPQDGVRYNIWFRGTLVSFWVGNPSKTDSNVGVGATSSVQRGVGKGKEGKTLFLRVYTRQGLSIVADIVKEAEASYRKLDIGTINIFRAVVETWSWGTKWESVGSKLSRPLASVIIEQGVAEKVVEDVKEFMESREWYRRRGIPHRRGYLMYGPPGTGKTSFIAALAAELGLDIYILPLKGLCDADLARLLPALPKNSILLVEDLDATQRGVTGRRVPAAVKAEDGDSETGTEGKEIVKESELAETTVVASASDAKEVTLSGLLNALDGIEAAEGRILFATTNHREALDPALCRPGRMDKHIEFKLASRWQAQELFKRFYPDDYFSELIEKRKTQWAAERDTVDNLAAAFSKLIPGDTCTMAMLQEYLMNFKRDPWGACEEREVRAFVDRVKAEKH